MKVELSLIVGINPALLWVIPESVMAEQLDCT
jgi:hypothetical protein